MSSQYIPAAGVHPGGAYTVMDDTDDPDIPRDVRLLVDSIAYRNRVDRWANGSFNHTNRVLKAGYNSMTGITPPAGKMIPGQSLVTITYSCDLTFTGSGNAYATIEIRQKDGTAITQRQVNLTSPGHAWASPSVTVFHQPPAQTDRFDVAIITGSVGSWEVRSQQTSTMCIY